MNGVDYTVLAQGARYEYANDEDCGNPAHRTAKGDRFFAHHHILYSYPVYGYEVNTGAFMNITNDNVKTFWDNFYGGLYGGTPNPKYNCWSYAFGFSTSRYRDIWIEDPTYIYADDYEPAQILVGDNTVFPEPGHVTLISEVNFHVPNYPNGFASRTYEKFRSSGLYERSYSPFSMHPPHRPYPFINAVLLNRIP